MADEKKVTPPPDPKGEPPMKVEMPAVKADGPAKSAPTPGPVVGPGEVDFNDLDAVRVKYGPEPADPKDNARYHEKIIADARDQQKARAVPPDARRYGVFANNPKKFVVVSEMVGKHLKGEEISYRDLIAYRDPAKTEVDFAATMDNADRLVAGGHIRPLIAYPGS